MREGHGEGVDVGWGGLTGACSSDQGRSCLCLGLLMGFAIWIGLWISHVISMIRAGRVGQVGGEGVDMWVVG